MRVVLGIDVGGTTIKAGLFTLAGELIGTCSMKTPKEVADTTFTQITSKLKDFIAKQQTRLYPQQQDKLNLAAIGLDIPGPVNSQGKVLMIANANIDIEAFVESLSLYFRDVPITVLNDANAAAMGELWQGSAKQYHDFVLLTLGTGVGAGVVIDGNIVPGFTGAAGEVGHMTLNLQETKVCGCGRTGCLEQYSSATGLVSLYKKACEKDGTIPCTIEHASDSKAVFKAFVAGDRSAERAIDEACDYLAQAMSAVAVIINPEAFVIGGGLGQSFDVFSHRLAASFQKYALAGCKDTKIVPALLGNSAGMYGAAYKAMVEAGLGDLLWIR